MHTALPLVVLYLPATQDVQVPPSGPVRPAAHAGFTHPFTDDVPLTEFVPAGQVKHVDDEVAPIASEYVLTPQFIHFELELSALYVPLGHGRHA